MNRQIFIFMSRFSGLFSHYSLMFVIPIIIYQETGDASLLGIIYAFEWGCRIVSLTIYSLFLKKYRYWKLSIISEYVRLILIIPITTLYFFQENILWLVLIGMINGLIFDINFMSVENILKNKLKTHDSIRNIQSYMQIIEQICILLPPIIGIVLINSMPVKNAIILLILPFFISLISAQFFVKSNVFTKLEQDKLKILRYISSTFYKIYHKKNILILVLQTNIVNLLFSSLLVLLPVVIVGDLKMANDYIGYISFSMGVFSIFVVYIFRKYNFKSEKNEIVFIDLLLLICFVFVLLFSLVVNSLYFFIVIPMIIVGAESVFAIYLRMRRSLLLNGQEFNDILPIMILLNSITFPIGGLLVSYLTINYQLAGLEILSVISGLCLMLYSIILIFWKLFIKKTDMFS